MKKDVFYKFEFTDGYYMFAKGLSEQELMIEESKHGKLLRKIEA